MLLLSRLEDIQTSGAIRGEYFLPIALGVQKVCFGTDAARCDAAEHLLKV
jgi:hypothetical protein